MMGYFGSLMSTGEQIQLVRRAHWISLVKAFTIHGLLIAALVLVSGVGFGVRDEGAGPALGTVLLLLALIPLAMLVRDVAQWYSRVYLITTRRVMQISGVLNKRVSDSNLDKVNDVVLEQSFLGRILNYGDIEIITGSDVGVDVLANLHDPIAFKRVMMDNKEDFDTLTRVTHERLSQPPDEDEDVPVALERLASLRDRGLISEDDYETKKADLLARM